MNAFQLRQLTIPLSLRSEVLFRLEDGTELEAVSYHHAQHGRTQDVVLMLRTLPRPVERQPG